MNQINSQKLFALQDEQIMVACLPTPIAGLALETEIHAGGNTCADKACCDAIGGSWDGAAAGGLGVCSDKGTGDWD